MSTHPRFFAYGGTEYSVRCKVGDWHEFQEGALTDDRGIGAGDLSFGIGLDDSTAYIVLKQLQKGAADRTYAYCVLIDPGAELWIRSGWNAAAIVQALQATGGLEEMLRSPEIFYTHNKLASCLYEAKMALNRSRSEPPSPDDLAFAIAGMGLSNERPQTLVVQDRGWSIPAVSSSLESLPEFLRIGCGWLVGFQTENAHTFGASLVATRISVPFNQKEFTGYISKGREFLVCWKRLVDSGLFPDLAQKLPTRPIPLSDISESNAARSFLDGLRLLDAILFGKISKEISLAVERLFQTNHPLSGELGHAISQLGFSAKPLDAEETNLFLKYGSAASHAGVGVDRLHDQTLIAHFVDKRLDPKDENLVFTRKKALAVYTALIQTERSVALLPNWLKDVSGVPTPTKKADPSLATEEELCQAAIERSVELGDLSVWFGPSMQTNTALRTVIESTILTNVAADRTHQNSNWIEWYFASEVDPGGFLLIAKAPSDKQLEKVLDQLNLKLSEVPPDTRVAKWMDALAGSPLRPKVPIEVKLKIKNRPKWKALKALEAAVDGQSLPSTASVTVDQQEYLKDELRDLLVKRGVGVITPETADRLRMLVAELPDDIKIQEKVKHEPVLPESAIESGVTDDDLFGGPLPDLDTLKKASALFQKVLFRPFKFFDADADSLNILFWTISDEAASVLIRHSHRSDKERFSEIFRTLYASAMDRKDIDHLSLAIFRYVLSLDKAEYSSLSDPDPVSDLPREDLAAFIRRELTPNTFGEDSGAEADQGVLSRLKNRFTSILFDDDRGA